VCAKAQQIRGLSLFQVQQSKNDRLTPIHLKGFDGLDTSRYSSGREQIKASGFTNRCFSTRAFDGKFQMQL
jgi:hypothetical protein